MKSVQWLLAFLTDSKGEYDLENDSAGKLSYDFTRTLLNKSFDLTRRIDEYKYAFKLPTKYTVGNPFYLIMIYENNRNNGCIVTPKDGYVLFFPNKIIAEYWKKKNYSKKEDDKTYNVLGVDNIFWNALKEYLMHRNIKVLIHPPFVEKGDELLMAAFDVNKVDEMIRCFKRC